MPRPPKPTPCNTPGCPTTSTTPHCPPHTAHHRATQAQQRRNADDPSMTAYATTTWRTRRRTYLRDHPTCTDCGARATQPDHVPPRELLIALGIHDPDHPRWLRPRCASCHARKTRTHDRPLLERWRNGADAHQLAEQAMRTELDRHGVGYHP